MAYHRPSEKFVFYNTYINTDREKTPNGIQEALKIPQWREVGMEEINALEKNGSLKLMSLPHGKKPEDYT